MNKDVRLFKFPFQADFPCSYFRDGRTASLEYVFADEENISDFDRFLTKGYRRQGNILYRNVCAKCSSCRPIRLETDKFIPSKSQKKTLRKNEDIHIRVFEGASVNLRKSELYKKYLVSKHHENGDMEIQNDDTLLSLHYGYPNTIEMDYYLGNKLVAVGIIDEGKDSLSSNYFYFDTDHLERRLGILSILNEISLARLRGKKYYYLGFYIEETSKMSYKKYFRPNQVLESSEWKDFLTSDKLSLKI